ncbi:hypothetical protein GCM10009549_08610 [Streptomyces thermoalcalitolerans]|uniref:Uncharacterized protein n=1 Tax=Streptomyces thermoalcalitolerans TaxID=65605 RepID=A0ABN1NEW5_9ACTN
MDDAGEGTARVVIRGRATFLRLPRVLDALEQLPAARTPFGRKTMRLDMSPGLWGGVPAVPQAPALLWAPAGFCG